MVLSGSRTKHKSRGIGHNDRSLLIAGDRGRSLPAGKVDVTRGTRAGVAHSKGSGVGSAGGDFSSDGDSARLLEGDDVGAHVSGLTGRLDLVDAVALAVEVGVVDLPSLAQEDGLGRGVADINVCHTCPVAPDDLLDCGAGRKAGEGMEGGFIAALAVLAEGLPDCVGAKSSEAVQVVCQEAEEWPCLIVVSRPGRSIYEDLEGVTNDLVEVDLCDTGRLAVFGPATGA